MHFEQNFQSSVGSLQACVWQHLIQSSQYYQIYENVENWSRAVDVLLLDFRNSFYLGYYKTLMMKVRGMGIQGNISAWIMNCLEGRRQRIIVNGVRSDWTPVHSGVP